MQRKAQKNKIEKLPKVKRIRISNNTVNDTIDKTAIRRSSRPQKKSWKMLENDEI